MSRRDDAVVFVVAAIVAFAAVAPLVLPDRAAAGTVPAAIDGVGLVDTARGRWHLRAPSGEIVSFYFGNPGDVPFLGDWDCDGTDSPGMYRRSDGYVYLRNSNTQGTADVRFYFGNPGDVPVAGDTNGDGCDTVSVYRPGEGRFYVIDRLGSEGAGLGAASADYVFGDPGDTPFAGDFDGDGVDTFGLHRASTGRVYLRNAHAPGIADVSFIFGDPGDRPVAGDWTGAGRMSETAFTRTHGVQGFPSSSEPTSTYSPLRSVPR